MHFKTGIGIIAVLCSLFGIAQKPNPNQERYIDSLTAHWARPKLPGGAIAIIRDGKVILQKSLGSAITDQNRPITSETSFQLGQLSNGFIAYAILQLHYNNQLSLEEAVHNYLPQLNLSKEVKIIHLLQQSSGIHDFEVLKHIVGWDDHAFFSMEDALGLIDQQAQLAFVPGSEFSQSRSNMLLASQVVEKATNMPFAEYMETQVFKTLGMTNTYVLSAKNQNTPNFARSYHIDENTIARRVTANKNTYAHINIVASIADMVRWEKHLREPIKNCQKAVDHFKQYVTLENGAQFRVPSGKLIYGQRNIHKERGIETTMATGGIAGFASAVFNFPSVDFHVITLSNNGEAYNGYIGMLSAHELLGEVFTEPTSIDFSKLKTIPLDKEYHKTLEGSYWDAVGELSRELRIEKDTLYYVRPNIKTALIPLSRDVFQMKTDFDDRVILTFSKNPTGSIQMDYAFGEATPFRFEKYKSVSLSETILEEKYAGHYYCKSMGIGYKLLVENGALKARNVKTEPIVLEPIANEVFSGNQWYMGSISFELDKDKKVKGFYVKNDAIRNLWFEKVQP